MLDRTRRRRGSFRGPLLRRLVCGVLCGMVCGVACACDSPAPAERASATTHDGAHDGARSAPPPMVAYDRSFRDHWQDGRAELSGYDLRFPRYGTLRQGRAVSIFVTEPFSPRHHVKVDAPGPDDVQVMKLNLVQDFQTGIYDYNLMTSVFVATEAFHGRPAGSPAKVSFSAQEWCGHVFAQARFGAAQVKVDGMSYFESEGDAQLQLPYPSGGIAEDGLLLWARQLAGPRLAPGERTRVPLLRSLQRVRLRHLPLRWDEAELHRETGARVVEVPAGRFEVETWRARVRPGDDALERLWTFEVEAAFPHRVVRFMRDDGLSATLRGSTRAPYWQLHDAGHEAYLAELGFPVPTPPATPATADAGPPDGAVREAP